MAEFTDNGHEISPTKEWMALCPSKLSATVIMAYACTTISHSINPKQFSVAPGLN